MLHDKYRMYVTPVDRRITMTGIISENNYFKYPPSNSRKANAVPGIITILMRISVAYKLQTEFTIKYVTGMK